MFPFLRFAALLLALQPWPLAAAGEQPSPSDLVTVENALEQSELHQKLLSKRLADLIIEEEGLANRLVAVASQLRDEEQRASVAAVRVADLQREKAVTELELASRQDELSQILAGLQRLEQNPPPALIVRPHDVLGALRSAMLIGTLAPQLRQSAGLLHDKLAGLASTEAKLQGERALHASAVAALVESRRELSRLSAAKQALALTLNSDLAAQRKRTSDLAAKATSLRELLESLRQEEERLTAERSKAEQRRKALAAIPQTDFAELKGQLAFPAGGNLAKRFGDDTGLGHPFEGIVISTAPAAAVTSPAAGLVEFAGNFRSYGEMLIINPGRNYLILLAGLGRLTVNSGQPVKAGEPVAVMGDRPAAMALAKDLTLLTSPMLYVEFRKNGEPVDPAPWWAGQQANRNVNQEAMR